MAKSHLSDFVTAAASNTDIANISIAEGMLPSLVNNAKRALLSILSGFYDDLGGVNTVGGTANAITITSNVPFTALATGLIVAFKNTGGPNTGAVTLNVDSLGAKAIRTQADVALSGGELVDDGVYVLRYDATFNAAAGAWVVLNTAITAVRVQTFTSSGTYTPHANMRYCLVEVWGGGGSGAGSANPAATQITLGSPGAAGGYACEILARSAIGATETVTIGAAGAAPAAGGNNGNAGGTTSLGSLISATGGAGGTTAASAVSAQIAGSQGGVGSGGDINLRGGAGQPVAGAAGGGTDPFLLTGNGGDAPRGGQGGRGGVTATGEAGNVPGGGGGGTAEYSGSGARAGGAGGAGMIVITEFCTA